MSRRKLKTQGERPTRDVNAAVRACTALDLAIAGYDYQAIAERAGYASRGAAFNAIQRELDRRITAKVDTLRLLHQARLGKLRTVYMPRALDGDGWSMDRVLRLDEREAALMGLDVRPDDLANAAPYEKRVIIVEADATNDMDDATQAPTVAQAIAAPESEADA